MEASKRRTFYLIDGHALVYRAFYAMIARPLRTSRGENTSAALGVANFLVRLIEKYRPDYLIWVFDKGDSFRTQVFSEYKSTREKLSSELQDDFDLAIGHVTGLLKGFRIPVITLDGYEADDVIGTLATREAAAGFHSVIVSGDKDFYQLIGPSISILNPGRSGRGAVEEQWVDLGNAAERFGIPPSKVADYLALVGDASDNVPGVRGVGEKTATQLLTQFESLEEVLDRASEVSAQRVKDALIRDAEMARLSRRLVAIGTDVPIEFDIEAARLQSPDAEVLFEQLKRLEFYALIDRLGLREAMTASEVTGEPTASPPISVEIVDDLSKLKQLLEALSDVTRLGIRTISGIDSFEDLIGLAVARDALHAWYLPFAHRSPDGPLGDAAIPNLPPLASDECRGLRRLLEDARVRKVGFDLKTDWHAFESAGVDMAGIEYDAMIASFVLDPGRRSHNVDVVAEEMLGLRIPALPSGARGVQVSPAEAPTEMIAAHAGHVAAASIAFQEKFAARMEEVGGTQLLDRIEMPLVKVLKDMEAVGIRIDPSIFQRLSREMTADLVRLESEIARLAGGTINLNSPKQLSQVLYERLNLPVLKRTKTGPSTDAEVLEQLAEAGHDLPRLLLEYRELQKLKSTYIDVLPLKVDSRTGRIHTRFNQIGAATGRLSSSEPNLQNIPIRTKRGEEIRRGFVPDEGWRFVVADYSQIELRIMAHFSEDPAFLSAFREGGDIHRQTAALIFGVDPSAVTEEMRARAKTINFGTIYGQGAFALSKQLQIPVEEAREFIRAYFERFAGVRRFLDRQVELAKSLGYVETLFKRRRYIPEVKDKNFNTRSFGERLSQNSPLQGSAADLIKMAMIRLYDSIREERLHSRILLQVHDELVIEAPLEEVERTVQLVRERMEGVAELRVPLVVGVGVGDNWLDAKKS